MRCAQALIHLFANEFIYECFTLFWKHSDFQTLNEHSAGKAGGEKTAPVDLTEMYALWANRGTDFIADVKTMPNNTVWKATVKSQTVNHYATSDVSNAGVRVILPEGKNHRRVSAIQPYIAVYVWRRIA